MLEAALRAAVLHDASGRTLRSLGDLVGSLPPVDPAEPTAEPPALAADLALADAVGSLLAGPHATATALSVIGPDGPVTYSARDVFATLAAALAHSTLFDSLTGLPTRRWILDEVDRRLADATPDAPVGLLQVELGQLKDINDSLGYELGDALIKEAARRLNAAIGPRDAVGRLVGDEFAVILGHLTGDDPIGGATECARRVLDLLAQGIRLGEHELQMQASVGICVVDGDGISAEHVLRRADSAMTRAKVSGRGRAELYDEHADRPIDRLSLTLRLREALAADAFSLHWQPIYRLRDGALVGAEALVRWQDENGRYIPPDEFIPYAETVGLIVPIGAMVLDSAAWQARRWRDRGLMLPVSVNLSPQQIVGSDVVGEVRAALGRHGVAPSMLRLELTETAAVTDFPTTRQRLAELRDLGVGLSLDDFGTGYSSLRLLRELAVDDVKVDRSFVGGLDVNGADAAMVRLVVETAHALGLTVTAEGVERPDQLTALAGLGCDSVQGFLLGMPLPVADFDTVGDAARALCEPATARAAANA